MLFRSDAVFSRLSMVLFMCRNKSSRNDLKLHGTSFRKISKILEEKSTSGGPHPVHEGGGAPTPWARPLPRGPPGAPPTSTPTLYIHVRGEKNQREGVITFYDTEPPRSPNLSREGRSGVRSGLRRGESVAVVIINLPPSPIS